MRKLVEMTALLSSLLFLGFTLWAVTVRGVLEPARYEVAHFEAGAGDGWLWVRGALATGATLSLAAAAFFTRPLLGRIALGVLALLMLPVFGGSCLALERWAPGFSEASFAALAQRQSAGESLTGPEVIAALGPPLFVGERASGESVWSYSYMPSSGYGWHKRIVWLHGQNSVTRVYALDEP